jgi:hypothetical protein
MNRFYGLILAAVLCLSFASRSDAQMGLSVGNPYGGGMLSLGIGGYGYPGSVYSGSSFYSGSPVYSGGYAYSGPMYQPMAPYPIAPAAPAWGYGYALPTYRTYYPGYVYPRVYRTGPVRYFGGYGRRRRWR